MEPELTHCWWECKIVQSLWWEIVHTFLKIKPTSIDTICPSHFTCRYLLMKKGSKHPYRDLHVNMYSSFICNSPNWKQPKRPSTGEWTNNRVAIDGISLSTKQKLTPDACNTTDESQMHYAKLKDQESKDCIKYDSIYMTI